jgi:hypothetical protein
VIDVSTSQDWQARTRCNFTATDIFTGKKLEGHVPFHPQRRRASPVRVHHSCYQPAPSCTHLSGLAKSALPRAVRVVMPWPNSGNPCLNRSNSPEHVLAAVSQSACRGTSSLPLSELHWCQPVWHAITLLVDRYVMPCPVCTVCRSQDF